MINKMSSADFYNTVRTMTSNADEILNAFAKSQNYIHKADSIVCGVSGGSDSDIVLDLVIRAGGKDKTHFVFFDTGVEYAATKEHLGYLEDKYGIVIERYRPKYPVPAAVKKCGQPFWSKQVSRHIHFLQAHGFKWEDKPFEELYAEYPKCKSALKWWCNSHKFKDGKHSMLDVGAVFGLKEFLMAHPPTFPISPNCCEYSKKKVLHEVENIIDCDLSINGIRKAEGGIRSVSFKSCFDDSDRNGVSHFRPIFWFTDSDKRLYEQIFNVKHSKCYTDYGLKRTGCAGCPFGFHKLQNCETEIIKEYEPKLYTAVNNIFGDSYDYTREFIRFRENLKTKDELTLFNYKE